MSITNNYDFEEVRLRVDNTLREISNSIHVYFQPPEKFKMVYPCIRYSVNSILKDHASNKPYLINTEFEVMLIYKEHTKEIADALSKLISTDYCKHTRHYIAEGLYHDIFTLTEEVIR